jgi:hypothetical protein
MKKEQVGSKWTTKRQTLINERSDKLAAKIDRAQNKLFRYLTEFFIPTLETDKDDIIIPTEKMMFIPSRLDNFYDRFNDEEVKPIISTFANDIADLLKYNRKYYNEIKSNDASESVNASVLRALGIDGSVIADGSLLHAIIADRSVIAAVKTAIMASTGTGVTTTTLKVSIEDVVMRRGGGILKGLFEEKLPEPYVKVDNFIGKQYATALKLNYAIYQGGTIGTSREFCIERNNKVFSRDEIAKFGTREDKFDGYTDKANGEFQGKNANYDPFQDLGGYNCRHFYSYISDELAFTLRPELEGRS